MKNKQLSLYDRLTKRVYEIEQLDEYKRSKVEHVSNLFFILFLPIFSLEILVGFLCGIIWPQITLYGLIGINFVLIYIWMLYLAHYSKKYKLNEYDIDVKDSHRVKKKVIIRCILTGISFFVVEFFSLNFVNALMDKVSFMTEFKNTFSWIQLFWFNVISAVFSITLILVSFANIKKFKS